MGWLISDIVWLLGQIGLEWLIDDDRRSKPWATLWLAGFCLLSLALIPVFHRTWEGWLFGGLGLFFGFLAFVDFTWWREERERVKRIQDAAIRSAEQGKGMPVHR